MTTELNFQRLSKGFVNVTLARRYGDLKGFFKGKIAHILEGKNETNETLFQVLGLSHFIGLSSCFKGKCLYFINPTVWKFFKIRVRNTKPQFTHN